MPLPLTVSCFTKIQIGFTFLVLAHPGSPGQRAIKRVCVCVWKDNRGRRTKDATSSGLSVPPPPPPPHFMQNAFSAATLPIYPGLGQASNNADLHTWWLVAIKQKYQNWKKEKLCSYSTQKSTAVTTLWKQQSRDQLQCCSKQRHCRQTDMLCALRRGGSRVSTLQPAASSTSSQTCLNSSLSWLSLASTTIIPASGESRLVLSYDIMHIQWIFGSMQQWTQHSRL